MPADVQFQNPLVVDAGGREWTGVPFGGGTKATDTLANLARMFGHDGLVVKNVRDSVEGGPLATTYAALRPGTVKSALTGAPIYSLLAALAGQQLPGLSEVSGCATAAGTIEEARMIEEDTSPHFPPRSVADQHRFRGRTIEGWYCIENGGVSVYRINSAGVYAAVGRKPLFTIGRTWPGRPARTCRGECPQRRRNRGAMCTLRERDNVDRPEENALSPSL